MRAIIYILLVLVPHIHAIAGNGGAFSKLDSLLLDKINYERSKLGSVELVLDSVFYDEVSNHNINLSYLCKTCGKEIKNGVMYENYGTGYGHGEFESDNDSIKFKATLIDRYPGTMSAEIVNLDYINNNQFDSMNIIVDKLYDNFYASKKGHKEAMLGLGKDGKVLVDNEMKYTSISIYIYPVKSGGYIDLYRIRTTIVFFSNPWNAYKIKYHKGDTINDVISSTERVYNKIDGKSSLEVTEISSGQYRLTVSAKRGNIEDMKTLIEKGADANVIDNMGRSALYWSVQNNNYDAVKLLLEHGANVVLTDKYGITPKNIDVRIMKILNDYGYSNGIDKK